MKKFILIILIAAGIFPLYSLGQSEFSPGAISTGLKGLHSGAEALAKTLLVPLANGLTGFAEETNDFLGKIMKKVASESSNWDLTEKVTFALGMVVGYVSPMLVSFGLFKLLPESHIPYIAASYVMGTSILTVANAYKQLFAPEISGSSVLSGLKEGTLAGLRSPLTLLLKGFESINKDAHNFVEQLKKASTHWSSSQKTLFSVGFLVGTTLPIITTYLAMKSFPKSYVPPAMLGTVGGTTFIRIANILAAATGGTLLDKKEQTISG